MQNNEYYDLYMREWEKILSQKEKPTDAEKEELRKIIKEGGKSHCDGG